LLVVLEAMGGGGRGLAAVARSMKAEDIGQ